MARTPGRGLVGWSSKLCSASERGLRNTYCAHRTGLGARPDCRIRHSFWGPGKMCISGQPTLISDGPCGTT
eukprot:11426955-Alexandrium_andersonii.AAC.1